MEKNTSKKDIGKFIIKTDLDSNNEFKNVLDFLELFLYAFAKQSSKYINSISNDAPFAYKERQLHSVLAPALSTFTDTFLMEQPISRKWDKRKNKDGIDYTGWVDYWCRFNEHDFFIEIKHDYDAYKNDTIRKVTIENWNTLKIQLDNVKKEARGYKKNCSGVYLIALHYITIFNGTSNNVLTFPVVENEKLIYIQDNYFCNLKPKPNWSALWILNKKLYNNSFSKFNKKNEFYPGVLITAKIDLIK